MYHPRMTHIWLQVLLSITPLLFLEFAFISQYHTYCKCNHVPYKLVDIDIQTTCTSTVNLHWASDSY